MRIPRFLPLLVVAMGCGGGLGSQDGIADAKISTMEDFVNILEGIKDKSSADAAKPKILEIKKRMEEIEAAAKKLGEPKGEDKTKAEAKLKAAQQKLEPRMQKAFERIQSDPEVMAAVASVMAEMGSMGR